MINYQFGQVPPSSIILPFYATGAVAFFILCLLMVWSPESLLMHYFNPHLLTMVHTAALGWGTMVIFGASYQLLPVISEHSIKSNNLAIVSWYFLLAGALILAWSFWNLTTGWLMITGGSLVVVAAMLYLINVVLTGSLSQQANNQRYFLVSSACWLLLTTLIGLLLAINLKYPFFSRNHMEILKVHAHLGLAGWFLQLITGVSSKLVPMFLLAHVKHDKPLFYSLILQNTGLIFFLADVYFFGYSHRVMIYAALVVLGVGFWLYYLRDNYKKRMRRKVDIQMKQTGLSFAALVLGVAALPVLHFTQSSTVTVVYGTLLFLGWITGIIIGQTFKTLPFIVWNEHYKNLTGKSKVPLPKDLYKENLVKIQLWVFIVAVLTLLLGIGTAQIWILRVAGMIWVGLALIYIYNVSLILVHRTTILD